MTCEELSRCARYGESINFLGTFFIEADTMYGGFVFFWSARYHPEAKIEIEIGTIAVG